MKILIINDYNQLVGGAEKIFFETIQLLRRDGHTVHTITSKKHKFALSPLSLFNLPAMFFVKNILRQHEYDIIHVNKVTTQLSHAILLSLPKNKVVMHVHDFSYICPKLGACKNGHFCPDYKKKFSLHPQCLQYQDRHLSILYDLAKFIRLSINRYLIGRYVRFFICPSTQLKKFMKETLSLSDNRFFYLPNFVPIPSRLPTKPHSRYFLFVGRIDKQKGVHVAILAIHYLIHNLGITKVKFLIIGDGPYLPDLRRLVDKLDLAKNIFFLGSKNNCELPHYYRHAYAVIMPSVGLENNPLVALEAMSYSLPIIASDLGGYPDLVRHQLNGYLFPVANHVYLARCLKKIYPSPKLAKKMGRASHKLISKQFNVHQYYKNLMRIYTRVNNH